MFNYAFCFTLGHNSSCAVVDKDTGIVVAAYEEERLTRIKSDKNFPRKSFDLCLNAVEVESGFIKEHWKGNVQTEIFVSHWYDNFDFYLNRSAVKHERFDYDFFEELPAMINCDQINYLNGRMTHHDVHGHGALAFYRSHKNPTDPNVGHVIVLDGFGNNQEVFSIYKFNVRENTLEKFISIKGYQYSLGLMYEFATEFMGMKPHEDEYKALGYESKIDTIADAVKHNITILANQFSEELVNEMVGSIELPVEMNIHPSEVYINIEEFEESRKHFFQIFTDLLEESQFNKIYANSEDSTHEKRIVVSFFIQSVLENVVNELAHKYCNYMETTLLLAGGVAYNVKLNNSLMNSLAAPYNKNKYSVYPLAGDQGAALGFYDAKYGNLDLKTKGLLFGRRSLHVDNDEFDRINKNLFDKYGERFPFTIFYDYDCLIDNVITKLSNDEIVEIIRGDMEFGPRALLANSTLAIPTEENVNIINAVNGRNTVMPFAPVVTTEGMKYLFDDDYEKVVGSLGYMILTLDYRKDLVDDPEFVKLHKGVMHRYPLPDVDSDGNEYYRYSGRPQVIDSTHQLYPILKALEKKGIYALIQTSFNVHGRPITFTFEHAIDDFDYQMNNKKKLGITKKINIVTCDFGGYNDRKNTDDGRTGYRNNSMCI